MMNEANNTLSPLQLELLRQFGYGLRKEEDLISIKRIIAKYFANEITNEMDKIWEENHYNNKTLENWLRDDS